jgi:hypothetical protein
MFTSSIDYRQPEFDVQDRNVWFSGDSWLSRIPPCEPVRVEDERNFTEDDAFVEDVGPCLVEC